MTKIKLKFVCNTVKWFDKVNGNTYHSNRITRTDTGETIWCPFQYGYGEHYRQTALERMDQEGWLPCKYSGKERYLYERENDYTILWNVTNGLKRECIENGKPDYL